VAFVTSYTLHVCRGLLDSYSWEILLPAIRENELAFTRLRHSLQLVAQLPAAQSTVLLI